MRKKKNGMAMKKLFDELESWHSKSLGGGDIQYLALSSSGAE